jgi:hypothetical protein
MTREQAVEWIASVRASGAERAMAVTGDWDATTLAAYRVLAQWERAQSDRLAEAVRNYHDADVGSPNREALWREVVRIEAEG